MSSFDIIKIYITALGSPLEKLIHHNFHLIYYIIKTLTYKDFGRSVFFQCEV